MTNQTPRPDGRWSSGLFRPLTLVIALASTALIGGLALGANSLSAPVTRAGSPTGSVTPLPKAGPATTSAVSPSKSATSATTSSKPTQSASANNWPKVSASGKFKTASNKQSAVGSTGSLRRFAVQVETSAKVSPNKAATQIAEVLNDPRSWAGSGNVRFALVNDPAKASFTVIIAAPATVKGRCKTSGNTCLGSGDVMIDASRWLGLPADYTSSSQWQTYLVNHGVGQLLGEAKQACPKAGRPAPVMMNQESELDGCTANPWPFP